MYVTRHSCLRLLGVQRCEHCVNCGVAFSSEAAPSTGYLKRLLPLCNASSTPNLLKIRIRHFRYRE